MTKFSDSLRLERLKENTYTGRADPAFEGAGSMFGGWTAALMLSAVRLSSGAAGSVCALTVNFIKRVPTGSNLVLRARRIGGGHVLSHWLCELSVGRGEEIVATAVVVSAVRSESERHTEIKMPDVLPPESLPIFRPAFAFYEHIETRCALGDEWFKRSSTRSIMWSRLVGNDALDAPQLTLLSDVGPPRAFYVVDEPRLSPTITLSVYIYATDTELSACGGDFILTDTSGPRMVGSLAGARSNIWSRHGDLLATTEQLQWAKSDR